MQTHFFIAMGRDEDDRYPAMFCVQFGLQLEAGDSRHADVCDQASSLMLQSGIQKFFRRGKFSGRQANRLQQAEQCSAHQVIIIYYGDWFGLWLSDHSEKIARSPEVTQLYLRIMSLILI